MSSSRSLKCLFGLFASWLVIAVPYNQASGFLTSNNLFGALSEPGNLMDLSQNPMGSLTNQMLGKPVRTLMSQLMSPKQDSSSDDDKQGRSESGKQKGLSSEASSGSQSNYDSTISNGQGGGGGSLGGGGGNNNKPASNLIESFLQVPPVFGPPGKLPNPLEATASLFNLTKGSFFGKMSGLDKEVRPESESVYYDHAPGLNPLDEYRKPKYFSHDCNFRVACEVGKLLRPVASPLSKIVSTNKVIQDLQNRYTRAATYGLLHNSCERYYCIMVELMGGPTKFAAGLVEMLNRLANPDLYELYDSF